MCLRIRKLSTVRILERHSIILMKLYTYKNTKRKITKSDLKIATKIKGRQNPNSTEIQTTK